MAYKSRGRKENDGKYLRLTGMWESKKKGLFTGKLRSEDVVKLIEKAEEADKAGAEMVFFLWENEQESRKDPIFTLQVSVADEEGRGRGRWRSSREEEEEPKRRSSRDEKEEEPEEEEEKPRRGRKASEPEPRGKKAKKNDW
jgi:hypothetical protein